MSLYGFFKGKGPSGFGYNSTAEEVTEGLDLTGKVFVVTGCNSGIGHETARALGLRGATVVGAARTLEKAKAACADFGAAAVPVACELSEPASVRRAVAAILELGTPIQGIVCNAGIMALPDRQVQYGGEAQLFTNHVGHFLLVTGLLEQLADDGRVVMTASAAHRRTYPAGILLDDLAGESTYSPWGAYGQSKLANVLFANHLATRLKPGQTANSVHPGVIQTNIVRHLNPVMRLAFPVLGPLALKTIAQGAATQTYVVAHPGASQQTGLYWSDCNPTQGTPHTRDAALAAALWERTEAVVAELPA